MSTHETLEQIIALNGGDPIRTATALEAGISRGAIRAAIASGLITQPARGTIAPRRPGETTPLTSLIQRCQALQARRPHLVFSHATAALLTGLPVRRADYESITAWERHPHPLEGAVVRRRTVQEDLIREVHGLRTTSPMCTAADLARQLPLPDALVTMDAVLRSAVLDYNPADRRPEHRKVEGERAQRHAFEHLAGVMALQEGLKGAGRAKLTVRASSPLAESPAESFSRGHFLLAGIVPLGLQHRVFDADGVERRLDFLLAPGLAGEVDGMVKYDGEGAARQLREEKNRDLLLERVDVRTLRWTGVEIFRDPASVVHLVRQAIARHRALGISRSA